MVRHNREHKSIVQSFRTYVVKQQDSSDKHNDCSDQNIDELVELLYNFCWFVAVGQRFSSTVLFLMIVTSCLDKLIYLSYCDSESIRCDEGLMPETSAFQFLYGGQFTLSTPLISQIFAYHSPTDAAPQFL